MINFQEKLLHEIRKLRLKIDDEKLNKYYSYYLLLIEWNKKINLTSIKEENEVIEKHFLDSLLPLIDNENIFIGRLLDIGSGAGFPGLPIKIYKDEIDIIMLDSTRKKVDFINRVINDLKIYNANAIHARAEELAKNKDYREKFNIVLSRAVAPLNILFEYCLPFVKINGYMIAYKSKDYEYELKEAKNALNKMGGKILEIKKLTLPISGIERSIIIIEKVKNTPVEYPRRIGVPQKKPIK
jgi:16S rRNA (guanine527-N7)-methyltransferase